MSRKRKFKPIQFKEPAPKIKFNFKFLLVLWILILVGFFVFYMAASLVDSSTVKSNKISSIKTISDNNEISSENSSNLSDGNTSNISNPVPENKNKAGSAYLSRCIFIGNEILAKITIDDDIKSSKVLCDGTYNLNDIDIWKDHSFETDNIYLMLGFSEMETPSDSDLISRYEKVLNEVRSANKNSKIYVLSIPPVAAENTAPSNSSIDEFNSKLLNIANSIGVYYLDTNTFLKDNTGYISSEYIENDGLNNSAYYKIVDYIAGHTVD